MSDTADGFDEVFRAMLPPIRRLTWRMLGDEASSEDATAEAFIRTLSRWKTVRHLPHRDAWITRVATNIALDTLRRRRREATVAKADPPSDDAADPALRLDVATALARLPRRQREVVVLRHIAGLTEPEVAAALGVSINTVKTHGSRGLATLRQDLGPNAREISDEI